MTSDSFILQAMVLLPLLGAALVIAAACFGVGLDFIRRFVLVNVLATFALSVAMVNTYDPAKVDAAGQPQLLQMTFDTPWLGTPSKTAGSTAVTGPNIRFSLGVDGISLWLIALTALLMIPAVLVSWEAIQDRAAAFYALMLVLQAGMIGVFAALDIILFYIFFEFTLIPLFFMIGLWGGYDRRWAARKFFIFTLAGSVLTFLGLIFIVLAHSWMRGSTELVFSIPQLIDEIPLLLQRGHNAEFWNNVSPWIFLALFAGFAIKVPLFPFHTWLPLAHVEAPTAGSVLLAGVLLKIGSYGFLRFGLALIPGACWLHLDFVAILCVIGIIYGALLALAQDDIKKLVAYSSVSHMGFCMLGLFAFNNIGITGGMLTMINHGLSTGALFAMVGMLYERYHTRDIDAFGGLATRFPVMAFFFILVSFSSIGLPGLNGFTGEVTALLGMFKTRPIYGILSLSGIIFGAWYMLQLVRNLMYGRLKEPLGDGHGHPAHPAHPAVAHGAADASHGHASDSASHGSHDHGHGPGSHVRVFATPHTDLNFRELAALVPLVVLIVWIGVAPQYFVSRMEPSIAKIVHGLEAAKPK
ncbi:MAG: nuoM [Planctomycetaceae bacterium]|nr:nuoM [Planctomycetaceae bacterium]